MVELSYSKKYEDKRMEEVYLRTTTYFCPLCDFEKSKKSEISEDQYNLELNVK